MEINLPGVFRGFNARVTDNRGDGDDRHWAIVSHNETNHNDPGFLSSDFPHSAPKLYITAESDEFDPLTLREWRDEGFDVEYLPMGAGGKEYTAKLAALGQGGKLGPCETYGIVAFGDAASECLEYFHVLDNNREFKLGCIVAYYPTRIPDPRGKFPSSVQVLAHLAGSEVEVVGHNQLVGIQGKRRVSKRKVERGRGTGGTNQLAYPSYTYDAEPGFAEHDLDEYEKVSAELAWSRSLAAVRKAFRRDVDLEGVLEQNVESKFYTRNLGHTMSGYTSHKTPHVTYFPTLTGGIGAEELQRFYSEFFLNSNPPSLKLTLLSRTIGADRVVDELHVAFRHTQEMPWILPAVPPTNKRVEVMVVSIVTLRGGKLYHEHIYWDQASVLVQTGLLNPKLVPSNMKEKGIWTLPVVGRSAARRLLKGFDDEEDGEADNELIPEWYSDDDLEQAEETSKPHPPKEKKTSQRAPAMETEEPKNAASEQKPAKEEHTDKQPQAPKNEQLDEQQVPQPKDAEPEVQDEKDGKSNNEADDLDQKANPSEKKPEPQTDTEEQSSEGDRPDLPPRPEKEPIAEDESSRPESSAG